MRCQCRPIACAAMSMSRRRECDFAGCGREANRGVLCQSHYNQKRQGKQLTALQTRNAWRGCEFEGCERPHLAKGYCKGHYDQLRAGCDLRPLANKTMRGTCGFAGCERPHQARGLCTAHYQQLRKGAELTPLYDWVIKPEAKCAALPGCEHVVYSAGLCRTHNDQRRRGVPFTVLPAPVRKEHQCWGPECARAREDADGLCRSHGLMQRRGQSLTPLVLRTPTDAGRQFIHRGVYWCTSCQQELPLAHFGTDARRGGLPRGICKLCQGIVTRASKYKRTFLDVYLLFEYQRYKCAICPVQHADGDGLHLDHDHTCCPGKGESCGQCIRGLLCWGCNGGVLPWYERIRGQEPPYPPLESYLNDPPAAALGLTKHPAGSA